MIVIIGLGNPGKEYEKTRHNAGFMMLDYLKEKWDFSDFKLEKKFNAEISGESSKLLLVKPQTFMNLSGESVQAILSFYKLTPDSLIVIHDDIDITLGKIRVTTDSSSAGHNGVQNIIEKLGTQKFRRIRIGIGKTPEEKESCPISAHDFVLGKFSKEELETIKKTSEDVLNEINDFQNSAREAVSS